MIEALTRELEHVNLQLQQKRSQEAHDREQMAITLNDRDSRIASLVSEGTCFLLIKLASSGYFHVKLHVAYDRDEL